MVNRIRLLPEHVANQIAAGEVIERPASVVKELVENSLDARSTRISVEIGAGGRSLIRVTDDGVGMSRDDALLCLERHATSKIQRAEDLSSIGTMGFRGEAIPSIASVSRFTLTTREREDASGEASQIVIHGGRILEVKTAANPTGTTVEVRQLFFNLPARRKFLRSEETERAHIAHYLTLVALAYPQVGFTYSSDGRLVWQLPPVSWSSPSERFDALRERLRQVHGSDLPLIPLDCSTSIPEQTQASTMEFPVDDHSDSETESSGLRVWGFIGAPGVSRSTREEQHVFVNQRPVDNRGLNFALIEGYHNVLMKGRYPVCCLFLEIDPAAVDVNVHPQKREVKFRDESDIRRRVSQAIREALVEFHKPTPPSPGATTTIQTPLESSLITSSHAELPLSPIQSAGVDRTQPPVTPAHPVPPTQFPSWNPVSTPPPPLERISDTKEPGQIPPAGSKAPPSLPTRHAATWHPTDSAAIPLLRVPLRRVGVIGRLYVLLESDRGLVLMDQHAAHERILYEQMLRRLESASTAASQRLLLPETLELNIRDTAFLRQNMECLNRLGVELREFGERTFLLESLPPFARPRDAKQFVLGLVDELKSAGTGVNTLRLGEDVVAKTVCRHSVKANDPLNDAELDGLVEDLRRCEMPYTCPHGRPTLIEMSWRELEKKFGRTG